MVKQSNGHRKKHRGRGRGHTLLSFAHASSMGLTAVHARVGSFCLPPKNVWRYPTISCAGLSTYGHHITLKEGAPYRTKDCAASVKICGFSYKTIYETSSRRLFAGYAEDLLNGFSKQT